ATTPGLSDLPATRQQQMLDVQKGNPDDPDLVTGLKNLVKDGFLDGLSNDEFDSAINLAGSPQFQALSEDDAALVLDGLKAAKGNTAYADNVKTLLADPKFKALDSDEQTAVLSQVKNYPDARSVANIDRMLQKDWFNSQDIEDKQRSLKVVAYLSQHDGGDRKVVDNTLNRFLDPASDYKLVWKDYDMSGDHITYGEGTDANNTLYLNRGLLNPDNKKMVEVEETEHLTLSTVPHEVNHIINKDHPANNYKYFEAEYRAWYVGFKAQFGRVPTNQEAMEQRITWQLDKDSFYGPYSAEALKKPAEAQKFYDLLSKMSGQKVNADNWADVIKSDPSKWKNPNGPDPVPGGNIDNHGAMPKRWIWLLAILAVSYGLVVEADKMDKKIQKKIVQAVESNQHWKKEEIRVDEIERLRQNSCSFYAVRNQARPLSYVLNYAVLPGDLVVGTGNEQSVSRILATCGASASAGWRAEIITRFHPQLGGGVVLMDDQQNAAAIRKIEAAHKEFAPPTLSADNGTLTYYMLDPESFAVYFVTAVRNPDGSMTVVRSNIRQ